MWYQKGILRLCLVFEFKKFQVKRSVALRLSLPGKCSRRSSNLFMLRPIPMKSSLTVLAASDPVPRDSLLILWRTSAGNGLP